MTGRRFTPVCTLWAARFLTRRHELCYSNKWQQSSEQRRPKVCFIWLKFKRRLI